MSVDLDYVTYEELGKVEKSLKKIGFVKNGKWFEHPECKLYIDSVTEPVAIGHEIIRNFEEMDTKFGIFKLLTASDCVKDRLSSFYHWEDRQSLDQAIDVCLDHRIDMKKVMDWSKKEGFEKQFALFKAELEKRKKESKKEKQR
jgi:hypothetical protein